MAKATTRDNESASPRKTCFVIAPIGEADSETRKRSDQVLKHVIRPAVEECGYTAVRADEIDKPGLITSQVIQHIVSDDLVIADLTERNPNVFYELAIRHALRKPLVQLIKKGETIPFDVAGTRTIYLDHRDLDSVDAARNEIIGQVRALEEDATEIETPISVSLDLQLLRQSDNPEDRSLADILNIVSELRASIATLESQVADAYNENVIQEIYTVLMDVSRRVERRYDFPVRFSNKRYSIGFLEELVRHASMGLSDPIAILMVSGLLRQEYPWLAELAAEIYRNVIDQRWDIVNERVSQFYNMVEFTTHHSSYKSYGTPPKDYAEFLRAAAFLVGRVTGDPIEIALTAQSKSK